MEIVNVTYGGFANNFQSYSEKDRDLISSNYITDLFGATSDYVETFIYDLNDQLLNVNYNYSDYSPTEVNPQNNLFSSILIDPEKDVKSRGFDRGSVKIHYNFLKKVFGSSVTSKYWIKEISPSRLELKLSSQDLSDTDIQNGFSSFQSLVSTRNYYSDFYLNFGDGNYIACVNSALSIEEENTYLLIKLYEPLSFEFDIKDSLWLVSKMAEPVVYNVDIQIPAEEVTQDNALRGPNFNVAVNQALGQTTPYYNYKNLFSTPVTSSLQKIKSWYDDKAVSINVDYTDFSNFVHFSSATERVKNFVYKLQLIEGYENQIAQQSSIFGFGGVQTIKSSSIAVLKQNIDSIVEKLDPYEYYLYFSSESFAWPKSNSTQPYSLYSVTSSQATNWLGSESTVPTSTTASLLYSASYYDAVNPNILTNITPSYIIDDENNAPYATFLHMIGQHFDNIWIYYKDVSNRYNANNNPLAGISKDLVADALRGFGVHLYTNSNVSDNLYYTLFGINEDGSLLPPTGSEIINTFGDNLGYVTSSLTTLASEEIQKEIYKRLYHNLPYLLKSKGTKRGVKALISCFGIPESLLTVKEFGGYSISQSIGLDSGNDDKISIYTSSLSISSSLLSPEASLQYFSNDDRRNSTVLEVGFSPSEQVNEHIKNNLSYFSMDYVLGSESDDSPNYQKLDKIASDYFAQYYQKRYNIWAYVRFLKFFNNSVFKMIKDFVPARAEISTGVIVKSHLLHRSKQRRYDPNFDIEQNYSQSIDQLEVYGGDPMEILVPTEKTGFFTSSLGYLPYTSSTGIEKYTGEFQNSEIVVTSIESIGKQTEVSNISDYTYVDFGDPNTLYYVTKSLDYRLNNISVPVRSTRFLDLDYSYNSIAPVNFGLITQSIKLSMNGPVSQYYNNMYSEAGPFAYMQDFGYYTNAWTVPRYYGSKTKSSLYTFYVQGESGSYGNTAAIDKQKYQYAYLVDIYTASFNLNGRANAQIKYMIDRDSNVLDLTKANTNIFVTQNVFKSGESVNISLFDYDPRNPDVQYLTNRPDLKLYEGGFRYSPMIFNTEVNQQSLTYTLNPPKEETSTETFPGSEGSLVPAQYLPSDFTVTVSPNYDSRGMWVSSQFTVEIKEPPLKETVYLTLRLPDGVGGFIDLRITVNSPAGTGTQVINAPQNTGVDPVIWYEPEQFLFGKVLKEGSTDPITITSTIFTEEVVDSNYCLEIIAANKIRLSATQSQYYGSIIQKSPTYPGIETPVFPLTLNVGDMFKFRVIVSNDKQYWPEQQEYRVALPPEYVNGRYEITLDRDVDASVINDNASNPKKICLYIINKHIPDETNVILRYDPKENITQDGILFPQYIERAAKDKSGNIIKSLKDQNLIQ
jgi:hypothetical protein